MKLYNRLSHSYDILYRENIITFQKRLKSIEDGDNYFVDAYPSLGVRSDQKCELLFYGQAVNGWPSGFDLDTEINQQMLENSVYSSNKYFEELNHTPLDWVNIRYCKSVFDYYCELNTNIQSFYKSDNNYWTHHSFYWKVVYKLTCDYYRIDRNSRTWAEKVACSNLYKISEDGKNPSPLYQELQFSTSVNLIKQEILDLKPKYCILLTNLNWWKPFQEALQAKPQSFDQKLDTIVSFDDLSIGTVSTKMIVTTRPYLGSGDKHVEQIMQLITK